MAISAKPPVLTLMPSTRWGWWAIGFAAAFFALTIVFFVIVASGQKGGETFADNLWLSIPGLAGDASAVLALATGLVGVIVRKERSLAALVATAVGGFVTIFLVAEFVFPG